MRAGARFIGIIFKIFLIFVGAFDLCAAAVGKSKYRCESSKSNLFNRNCFWLHFATRYKININPLYRYPYNNEFEYIFFFSIIDSSLACKSRETSQKTVQNDSIIPQLKMSYNTDTNIHRLCTLKMCEISIDPKMRCAHCYIRKGSAQVQPQQQPYTAKSFDVELRFINFPHIKALNQKP